MVDGTVSREMFLKDYASVFDGDHRWKGLDVPEGELFAWNDKSTYVRKQTFFDGMKATPDPVADIHGARVLALLGDSVTTDHISPAGGVKAVITESFERIHRSNLIGMGVLPLQFPAGESYESLGLNGTETYDIAGVEKLNEGVTPKTVHVTATHEDGSKTEFDAVVRIDTPGEADYYRNGGILQYVLRNLMK